VLAIAVGITAAPAHAAPGDVPPSPSGLGTDPQSIASVWTTYEVPEDTQLALFAKIDAGELLDSQTGAVPDSQELVAIPGGSRTISRYADGSISLTDISTTPSEGVTTQSVGDCSSQNLNGGTNCLVSGWWGPVESSFRADYQLGEDSARILAYNTENAGCGPGTCSNTRFEVIRLQQAGTYAAQVNLATDYSFPPIVSYTQRLSLFVKNRSASTN